MEFRKLIAEIKFLPNHFSTVPGFVVLPTIYDLTLDQYLK